MLFNSFTFLVFLPVVFLLYWFVFQRNLKVQNFFLLIVSYIFYGWWDWRFLSLIIVSSFVDYYVGSQVYKTEKQSKRKWLLGISLLVNLGFLGFFKYYNFFVESFIDSFSLFGVSLNINTLQILLPVGISFYTFQTLSYTIDIYRKELEPAQDIIAFFAFVSFFPQLVAGPIERARNLIPRFQKIRHFDYDNTRLGLKIILWGMFKKVVIADNVAILVDTVFNNPESYTGVPLLVGSFFFAIQIYCDFSGYSDIAIGTAKLFGFELMTNFNRPYYSKSITEFWRRWHISLSTWFRDYVYIPLGGSRVSISRHYTNLFITFLVSGLWHGANWTFVIWGAYHGVLIVLENFWKRNVKWSFSSIMGRTANKYFKLLTTFILVCIGWVFFRANSVSDAFYILQNMFIDVGDYTNVQAIALKFRGIGLKEIELARILVFIAIMELYHFYERKGNIWEQLSRWSLPFRWGVYYILIILILFFGPHGQVQNFIYFQF